MESGNHIKHHDHYHYFEEAEALGRIFFLNLTFTLIEIAGSLWTNSVAILSDALHDAGDSLMMGLAWFLQKASKKKNGINVFHTVMDVCRFWVH